MILRIVDPCEIYPGQPEDFSWHDPKDGSINMSRHLLISDGTLAVLTLFHEIGHLNLTTEGNAFHVPGACGKAVLYREAAAWREAARTIRKERALLPKERAAIRKWYGSYVRQYHRGF